MKVHRYKETNRLIDAGHLTADEVDEFWQAVESHKQLETVAVTSIITSTGAYLGALMGSWIGGMHAKLECATTKFTDHIVNMALKYIAGKL